MKRTPFSLILGLMLAAALLFALLPAQAAEPASTGTGLMPGDQLLKLIRWIDDGHAKGKLYEDVAALAGVEGLDDGNKGPNSMTALGDHYFDWIDQDNNKRFIHVCFRGKEDTGRFEQAQWQTNGIRSEEWADADITDWLIAAYAGIGTEAFSGTIKRFDIPTLTVEGRIPSEGWSVKAYSGEMNIMHDLGNNYNPRIVVRVADSQQSLDLYIKDYIDIQPVEPRMIAGIQMQGRTYTYMKEKWVEYCAQLEDNVTIGVRAMTALGLVPGTQAHAVLESLAFRYTAGDADKAHGPNPEPTATPEPTPTPTPSPTPEPTPTPAPKLADGVDRFVPAIAESDIPAHWQKIELVNEKTGIGMQVYFPKDTAYANELVFGQPNYYSRGSMSAGIQYARAGWRPAEYMVGGLFALSKPNEVKYETNKYLAGGNMDNPKNIFERLQTESGLLIERVAQPDGLKVQYCVISPPTEDGETVFLNLQVVAPEEDMKSDWCRELCSAFEQTLTLVYPGKTFVLPDAQSAPAAQPAASNETPTPPQPAASTAEPAAPQTASGIGIEFERTYTAHTFVTQGTRIDTAAMGVYSVTFHENNTCDFTLIGTLIKDLAWQVEDGKIVMQYFTTPITFTPTAEGIEMDYFGTGTLEMR